MTAIGQESEMDTQGVLPFAVDDPLLTAAEAAEVLGVSRWWFGELVRRGRVGSGGGFWCGDRWDGYIEACTRLAIAHTGDTVGKWRHLKHRKQCLQSLKNLVIPQNRNSGQAGATATG